MTELRKNVINPPRLFRLGFLSNESTDDRLLQGLSPQVISNLCLYNYVSEGSINFSNSETNKLGPLSLPTDDVSV
jgi:hypothetical protein